MSAVWSDNRNGPRERARAETLSQGLSGGVTPDFPGPGRFYGPRHTDRPIVRDPGDYPISAAVDDVLRGDEPVTTRPPKTLVDRPLPEPGSEVPWEQNGPHQPGFLLRRDHQGSAQVVPSPSGVRPVADYLGAAYFAPDGPAAVPPGACLWCGETLQPAKHSGGGTDKKKYCSASHRAQAATRRKKQAASLS